METTEFQMTVKVMGSMDACAALPPPHGPAATDPARSSAPCPGAACSDVDQQVAARPGPRAVARRDDGRRLGVLHDGRPLYDGIRADGLAPPDRRLRHAARLREPGLPPARRLAGRPCVGFPGRYLLRSGNHGRQRPVHPLHRACRVFRAVAGLVGGAERGLAGGGIAFADRARRQVHMDFEALARVAHIGETPELRLRCPGQAGKVLLEPRLKPGIDGRDVPGRRLVQAQQAGDGRIQPALRRQHADRRADAGGPRHHNLPDAERPRDPRRMQRPGPAEGHERIVARVAAALHRNDAQRVFHIAGRDQVDAPGGLRDGEAERPGDLAVERRLGRGRVECHRAAVEIGGVEVAEREVRVRHCRPLAAGAVTGGAGVRARAFRSHPDGAVHGRGDRAAARADLDQLHRRHIDRQAGALLEPDRIDFEDRRNRRLAAVDGAEFRRGAAHVEAEHAVGADVPADPPRKQHARSRAALDDADGIFARQRGRDEPAVRLHDGKLGR